ncbi:MAG: site-2 protease family protein [Candidatus Aenigmatarchaeota archaeon]
MEKIEIRDLIVSALLLALAFAIAFNGGIGGLISSIGELPFLFVFAIITVSLSFILHELGHRFMAKHYGCFAEYKMWPKGLFLALMLSLFGFVFAAPGAVYIHPRHDLWGGVKQLTRKAHGIISATGPAINIILAFVFLFLTMFARFPHTIANYGIMINAWLAIFNLIPFGPLDGKKILEWNKIVWGGEILISIALYASMILF